jgi:hypothetical protein
MNSFKTLAAASALALMAAPGSAAILDYHGLDGRSGVTVSGDVGSGPSYTGVGGAFKMGDVGNQLGLGDRFIAFCLDLAGTIQDNYDYVINNVNPFQPGRELSSIQVDNVKRVFNSSYASVDVGSNVQAAAFQLALWDAAYEDTLAGLGLSIGIRSGAGTGTNAAAVTSLANTFLDNAKNWDGVQRFSINFLDATVDERQDLVMATPVPVPAAGLLLIAGIGAFGIAKRRQRKPDA